MLSVHPGIIIEDVAEALMFGYFAIKGMNQFFDVFVVSDVGHRKC